MSNYPRDKGELLEFIVKDGEEGLRLEHFVSNHLPSLSRGSVRRLLQRRQIRVNGQHQSKGYRLNLGDKVCINRVIAEEPVLAQPELPLQIIAELSDYVVLNKSPQMSCHPLIPGEIDTVANALVARYPECLTTSPQAREGGLVHRLDWSTSGVLVAARTRQAYLRLRQLFSTKQICKYYWALVKGKISQPGSIKSNLRTVPGDRRRMEVFSSNQLMDTRMAETEFRPLQYRDPFSWIEIQCYTGQRHQVRVHLAHCGFPLVDDELYGGPAFPQAQGAFLHAHKLILVPENKTYTAPLPSQRAMVLAKMGLPLAQIQSC